MRFSRSVLEDPTLAATGGSGSIPRTNEGTRLRRGESVDRFVIIDELGRGAMGTVYAAFDTKLERQVALKLLHSADRGIGGLLAEAQALARINHPNVVTVHDVGEHDGRLFLAMELVRGKTLRDTQRAADRTWREILEHYRLAARGLAAVHAADLVHGDFKPENVMVAEDGRVLVMDFGIARSLEPQTPAERNLDAAAETTAPLPSSSGSSSIEVSRILGTPAYMAPEQFNLDAVGPLTDQFAFCVALHEGLWGQRPFDGDTLPELALAVTTGARRPRPSRSAVPRWLGPIVDRGLALEPTERFASLTALDEAFDASLRRRMKVFSLLGAAGLTATIATAVVLTPSETAPCEAENRAFQDDVLTPQMAALKERVTSLPHRDADAVWVHMQRNTEAFATEWVAANAAQCVPSPGVSAQVQAARRACLDRQRQSVTTALALLNDDAELSLPQASSLSSILPLSSRCLAIDEADGTVDPHTAELKGAHQAFGQARSRYALGQQDEAEALVTSALAQIESFDAHRLRAQMLLWRSSKRRYRGNGPGALEDARAAQQAAALSGSRVLAVDAWLTRIGYTTVVEPDARERIETLVESAELALLAAGDPADLRAKVWAAKASWLDDLGRSDEAVPLIRKAIALAEEEHLHAAPLASMYNLSGAIVATSGDIDAARAEFERSIALRESLAGPYAPGLTSARGNVGSICMMQNDLPCARQAFERIKDSLEASGDQSSTAAAQLESTLAELAFWEGKPEQSERHARACLSIARAGGFADRSFAIHARRILLRRLQAREAWEEGAKLAEELVQASQKRYADTPQGAPALVAAAEFHSASGDHPTAVALVQTARASLASTLEVTDPRLAEVWRNEAIVMLNASRLDEADSAVATAKRLLASAEGATLQQTANVRFTALQIQDAHGERPAAIAEAKALVADLFDDAPQTRRGRQDVVDWLSERGVDTPPPPIAAPK